MQKYPRKPPGVHPLDADALIGSVKVAPHPKAPQPPTHRAIRQASSTRCTEPPEAHKLMPIPGFEAGIPAGDHTAGTTRLLGTLIAGGMPARCADQTVWLGVHGGAGNASAVRA